MHPATHAQNHPDRPAYIMAGTGEAVTYRELNDRSNQGAQLFPNPFHPDQGEVFHLGNIPEGEKVVIYNMIGEHVYSFRTKGNPGFDVWDGLNLNGVRVVTGIYFLVVKGKVYRVAVVRG